MKRLIELKGEKIQTRTWTAKSLLVDLNSTLNKEYRVYLFTIITCGWDEMLYLQVKMKWETTSCYWNAEVSWVEGCCCVEFRLEPKRIQSKSVDNLTVKNLINMIMTCFAAADYEACPIVDSILASNAKCFQNFQTKWHTWPFLLYEIVFFRVKCVCV